MSYTIRDSIDVQFTKAPAIAIAGPSGSGKTESAMRLARGYCGPGERFVVIDTEEKRALYKKERYQPWDWIDFQPPFAPENCREVLEAARGYRAVIWDSGSHEYAGEGGISDIAEDELEKLAKGDAAKMEKLIAPSWKNAKRRHKRALMSYLIRYPTLLIICLRAEPKVKFIKEKFTRQDGSVGEKNTIVDAGYQPICEKMFMYEMLVGCKMIADNAGVPEHIKQLEPDLEPVFLAGKRIDESTGERLAAWSNLRAGKPESRTADAGNGASTGTGPSDPLATSAAAAYITADQVATLETLCTSNGVPVEKLRAAAKVERLTQIHAGEYDRAKKWVDAAIAKRAA